MPKNYQISQYDEPIAVNGEVEVEVEGRTFRIEIERAHMEEDTGKSAHVAAPAAGSRARSTPSSTTTGPASP